MSAVQDRVRPTDEADTTPLHLRLAHVHRIAVTADGAPLAGTQHPMGWWQTLDLFDDQEHCIGRIVLQLTHPDAALPVGEQPPYWGVDPRRLGTLVRLDEEPPF